MDRRETEAEELGLDFYADEDASDYVDGEIFLCTVCNWWCDIDEWTCRDCASLE